MHILFLYKNKNGYGLEYTKRWNDFKRFVQNNGGSVKISIYYSFELVSGISYMPVLNTKIRVAYSSWNGRASSFDNIQYNGSWEYTYK